MRMLRRVSIPVLMVLAVGLGASACTKDGAIWNQPGETPDPPKINLMEPLDGATGVSTAVELKYTLEGASSADVTLADANGTAVTGAMRADGSSWMPDQQLAYATQYTATIKATKSDGTSAEAKATFTTMDEPYQAVRVSSYNGDGVTYGIGMPIIVVFDTDVPEHARAEVQRRMIVETTPAQEGTWHWISSAYHNPGSQVNWRPKEYWQPGTTIHVRIATGGVVWYDGINGANDLTLDFTIGGAFVMDVDNATKQMTVTQDGQVVRTIPVSLGKPSTPSSSGTMLVMTRHDRYTFDTRRELGVGEGYVTDVDFAERLTTGGEFIHSAPWSISQQGNTNVSHGCVNMSPENAEFIYNNVKIGDPITVRGTEVQLEWGNGFTDWNIPWEEYVKGSAIPYEPAATPSAATTASPTS